MNIPLNLHNNQGINSGVRCYEIKCVGHVVTRVIFA